MTEPVSTPRDFHPSVVEAASWRLGSELVRRHPHHLVLLRTHPGGGQYDCLSLATSKRDPPRAMFQLNRRGSIQVHRTAQGEELEDPPRFTWLDYLSSEPYTFLRRLEDLAHLASPETLPASTPASLTLRLIAALAITGVMSVHAVEVHSGFLDSSGMWSGPRDDLFEAFPPAQGARRQSLPGDPFDIPEYRFWFVTIDDEAVLAFESTGRSWNSVGEEFDLMGLYERSMRRLWPVVVTIGGHRLR